MPSKSKAQQRFFGMVDAYKKGEMKNASSKIKKAAKGMSMDDVKDFAETKHKGLPEKVEEQTIIRLTESDLHRIVKESVQKILKEEDDPIGQFADICCKDEEILRCKTADEVFNTINSHLQKTYKGRATEMKIASVAKDVTVSVCLKLHIPGI